MGIPLYQNLELDCDTLQRLYPNENAYALRLYIFVSILYRWFYWNYSRCTFSDIHLHDTYYVVAHFHYVMMGGTLMALLAGLHYWWPKMTGRMYNETLGKVAAWLIFIGFNLTFLPQFVMGSQGMPRRYYNYIDQFTPFHQTSTIGSYVLGVAFLIILFYLVKSMINGKKAPSNPWNSRGLEWQATSPPDFHNFDHTPVVIHGPYDYHKPMEEFQLGLAVSYNDHDAEHALNDMKETQEKA